jgi:hypothetical protein
VSNIDIEMLRRQLDRIEASRGAESTATRGGSEGPPQPPDTWTGWRISVDARLSRLEGALEGLRGSVDGVRWIVAVVAAIMIGGFGFLGIQLNHLEGRVDRVETAVAAIPVRLSDEFRAMRSELAQQTSAIANSITATRQAQPLPPQVIVIPAPQPPEKPPQR